MHGLSLSIHRSIDPSINQPIPPPPNHPHPLQNQPQTFIFQVGVLEELAAKSGFKLNFKEALIGGAALDAKDDPFPDESLKA